MSSPQAHPQERLASPLLERLGCTTHLVCCSCGLAELHRQPARSSKLLIVQQAQCFNLPGDTKTQLISGSLACTAVLMYKAGRLLLLLLDLLHSAVHELANSLQCS